jgi:acyl carrier protein
LSAVKPGFGQLAYCAANNFVEAFCRARPGSLCISWDVWQGEGMAYDATAPAFLENLKQSDFRQRGLTAEEGVDVFMRALGSSYTHLLVCTSDYLRSGEQDMAAVYAAQAQQLMAPARGVRPQLQQAFTAADTPTEQALSQLWTELLGIEGIGIDDDFFSLGGDSLIGTLLVSRIEVRLGVRLPTRSVYEHRTIRALGVALEEALITGASTDQLREVLQELQHMA